jgi:NAD(P)-dependent dehydrogenase (short-subunit alcohol dehydrogenase family)
MSQVMPLRSTPHSEACFDISSIREELMLLKGKTAIVTGAASGIGRAIALAYAREGANVIASDLDEDGGNETISLVNREYPNAGAAFVRSDASDAAANESLVSTAVERFGALHIGCNNAGISGELKPLAELEVDEWDKVLKVNLSGVFFAMRAQIPRMLEAGGGAIVNIASILGQVGTPNASAYVAAKHGVVGLTQTAALEYSGQGLRINSVGPGYIETPLLENVPEDERKGLVDLHPIGRLGRSEEVADLVVWLSSDRASFVTGAYYPVDGGYLAR